MPYVVIYMPMTAHTDASKTYHTAYTAIFLTINVISFTVLSIVIDIQTGFLPNTSHRIYLKWEFQVRDRTTSGALKWDKSGMQM